MAIPRTSLFVAVAALFAVLAATSAKTNALAAVGAKDIAVAQKLINEMPDNQKGAKKLAQSYVDASKGGSSSKAIEKLNTSSATPWLEGILSLVLLPDLAFQLSIFGFPFDPIGSAITIPATGMASLMTLPVAAIIAVVFSLFIYRGDSANKMACSTSDATKQTNLESLWQKGDYSKLSEEVCGSYKGKSNNQLEKLIEEKTFTKMCSSFYKDVAHNGTQMYQKLGRTDTPSTSFCGNKLLSEHFTDLLVR